MALVGWLYACKLPYLGSRVTKEPEYKRHRRGTTWEERVPWELEAMSGLWEYITHVKTLVSSKC